MIQVLDREQVVRIQSDKHGDTLDNNYDNRSNRCPSNHTRNAKIYRLEFPSVRYELDSRGNGKGMVHRRRRDNLPFD